jgi:hypothetical protein
VLNETVVAPVLIALVIVIPLTVPPVIPVNVNPLGKVIETALLMGTDASCPEEVAFVAIKVYDARAPAQEGEGVTDVHVPLIKFASEKYKYAVSCDVCPTALNLNESPGQLHTVHVVTKCPSPSVLTVHGK